MALAKQVRFGPVALTVTTTTNILNPGTTTGGVGMPVNSGNLYFLLKHIRITNKSSSPATFSFWLGATGANAAGTEVIGNGQSVAALSSVDWYGLLRIDATDFLVGGSNTASALTFEAEGDLGVA